MTDIAEEQAPKKKRARSPKQIWDFAELEKAIADQVRIKPTPIGDQGLAHAARCASGRPIAQLNERVYAWHRSECSVLAYCESVRGEPNNTSLPVAVLVYPAAGGRTTYRIDDSVNGWFANAHLPMDAKDRSTRSQYASRRWFHGQRGVYQKGHGPFYPDAGPEAANLSIEKVEKDVMLGSFIPQEWKEKAISMVRRLSDAVSPFKDSVLRYNVANLDYGVNQDTRHWGLVEVEAKYHTLMVGSKYALFANLKSPCSASERGHYVMVPDLEIGILGPLVGVDEGPDIHYTIQLSYPSAGQVPASSARDYPFPFEWRVTTKPAKVIEAARQWAAERVYVPCN